MITKTLEIEICSLCKGLWMTLDDSCPCNCKNRFSNNDIMSEKHFMEFDDYIENQVNLVRELLLEHSILPGEKIKITYTIEPQNNIICHKHKKTTN